MFSDKRPLVERLREQAAKMQSNEPINLFYIEQLLKEAAYALEQCEIDKSNGSSTFTHNWPYK